ncbi:hypothetical protein ASF18_01965 [Methylobacterium sp. Leaf89]|nr:hypothetical protein ASF18_01965 [Methylobacterium sp. Leaf89]
MVFLRNDCRRDLPNGSLGEVVSIETDGDVIAFFDGTEHRLTGRALDDLDHAYAITVHKAQGSAFRTVVIPIVASRLLDRSLIYTALTQGIERVVFVGSRDVLQTGLIEAIDEHLGGRTLRSRQDVQPPIAVAHPCGGQFLQPHPQRDRRVRALPVALGRTAEARSWTGPALADAVDHLQVAGDLAASSGPYH